MSVLHKSDVKLWMQQHACSVWSGYDNAHYNMYLCVRVCSHFDLAGQGARPNVGYDIRCCQYILSIRYCVI